MGILEGEVSEVGGLYHSIASPSTKWLGRNSVSSLSKSLVSDTTAGSSVLSGELVFEFGRLVIALFTGLECLGPHSFRDLGRHYGRPHVGACAAVVALVWYFV